MMGRALASKLDRSRKVRPAEPACSEGRRVFVDDETLRVYDKPTKMGKRFVL